MVRSCLPRRFTRLTDQAVAVHRLLSTGAVGLALVLSTWAARTQAEEPELDPVAQELGLQSALYQKISGDDEASLTAAEAADSAPSGVYLHALLLLEQGKLEQAIELLEPLSREAGVDDPVQMYLAAALLHAGQADRSKTLLDRYLSVRPDDPQALYLDGVASAMQGDEAMAESRFRHAGLRVTAADQVVAAAYQVPAGDPAPGYGSAADLAGRSVSMPPAARYRPRATTPQRFFFTLLSGIEYDSNVPLAPQFIGLGSIDEREDARSVLATFADLQVLGHEQVNAGLIASTFNSFQFDLDAFNLQDYMGGAYANAVLAENVIGGIRYEYHSTLLNNDHLASEHRLTPNVSWLGTRGHTTFYYEYNPITSSAPALIPAQLQSASLHGVGLTQAIYTFCDQGRIYFGYRFETADADGSDFERDTHMATMRVERPLPKGWIGDGELRHFWSDYENPNSLDFLERPREDNRWEVRLGVQRNFLQTPWTIRFDYTYFDNTSNVANLFGVRFYDYDRHVASSQLIYSF